MDKSHPDIQKMQQEAIRYVNDMKAKSKFNSNAKGTSKINTAAFIDGNLEKGKYNNESRNLLDSILTVLYYQAKEQKKYNRNFELKFKKQLSKQAKKELALKKSNSSSWNWEDEL